MMGRKISLSIAFLVFCFGALSVSAQNATTRTPAERNAAQSTVPESRAQVSPETADLAITATVTAKELSFKVVPNPTVEFSGKPERDTVWDAERDSLPQSVQPGVTYRNIGIRLKIVSRFADIERIVAEALGEVPATDSMPQKETGAPQQNTQPPASTSQPNGGPPR
ncbi:MAG: hypothetical protein QOH63_2413 [Acidobacteriota bacterium]|jgi:hypothetical protein|nr:hypothetical protein [Acidobacteriota bacterium]